MKIVNAFFDRRYERKSWPKPPGKPWDRFYCVPIEDAMKAAAAGDADAAFAVGDRFDQGDDDFAIAQDLPEALVWYRLAEKANQPDAINNIGSMHEHGEVVRQDDLEARRRYEMAAALGCAAAMNNLGHFFKQGRGGLPKDARLAVSWFERGGALFDENAAVSAGYAHSRGEGVRRNERRALYWYRCAAALGSERAFNNLGVAYWFGTAVPRDRAKAVRLFQKAHERGHEKCAYYLALAHRDGDGAERNLSEALRLLYVAKRGGDEDADEAARALLAKHPELADEALRQTAGRPAPFR